MVFYLVHGDSELRAHTRGPYDLLQTIGLMQGLCIIGMLYSGYMKGLVSFTEGVWTIFIQQLSQGACCGLVSVMYVPRR